MYTESELCERISSLYPDLGECGREIGVHFDEQKHTWVVRLSRDGHWLEHYLEIPDADPCMEGRHCISLGLEIAQLRSNLAGKQF